MRNVDRFRSPLIQRLHVTGNAGAGKTTLARALSERFDLPLHHLDGVVWRSGWQKTPDDEKAVLIAQLTAGDRWLIEGVSDQVRERADLVIFLDTPRWRCLLRCARRCLVHGWTTRPELPDDCPEMAILFRALRIAWRFPALIGDRIRREASERGYLVARTPEEAVLLLEQRITGS